MGRAGPWESMACGLVNGTSCGKGHVGPTGLAWLGMACPVLLEQRKHGAKSSPVNRICDSEKMVPTEDCEEGECVSNIGSNSK